jgi:hypothetical protein
MKPIAIFPEGSFIKDINFESDIQYNLFVDFIPNSINVDEVNILFLCEPDVITRISKYLSMSYKMFDFILTHNQDILNNYSNAELFTFNSIWASNKSYEPKEFNISTLVGNKTLTKNQVMRQELWCTQLEIPNRKFYASSFGPPAYAYDNPSIGENKDELFKSQFHIAIENCSIDNYFTEKILDCFISKTVPIYCGCTNIGKYFNENGVLKFNNIKECIEICKKITADTYNEMLPAIEENYNKALEYINWNKRIEIKLNKLKINKN